MNKAKSDEIGIAVSAVIGVLAVIVLTIAWGGLWTGITLATMWGWFASPIFGLPDLGIVEAYGLALTTRVLFWRLPEKSKDDEGLARAAAKAIYLPPLMSAVLLCVGWCASAWV